MDRGRLSLMYHRDLTICKEGVCFPSIPSLTSNDCKTDTAHEKAECRNSVFASNLVSQTHRYLYRVPNRHSRTQLFLDSVSFSSDKVESMLSNLDSDSATGPDGISTRVLKSCSAALAHPLSVFYSIHTLICSRSSAICLEISKHYCPA